MKDDLVKLRSELAQVHLKMAELFKKAEEVRSYYKYQNENTDSMSESFILNFNSFIGDTYGVIDDLDNLIEYEEENECDCEEK